MKIVYVNEEWCLGCHLCEYYCAYANQARPGEDMAKALMGKAIYPRIRVEGEGNVTFAVSCRHCTDPRCVSGCISGALSVEDGVVKIDKEKCVGCLTCVLSCPYGAVMAGPDGKAAVKCELCLGNIAGEPACVKNCINKAIVFEDRGEAASKA